MESSIFHLLALLGYYSAMSNAANEKMSPLRVNFPLPNQLAEQMINFTESTRGLKITCDVQSQMTYPRSEQSGFVFMECLVSPKFRPKFRPRPIATTTKASDSDASAGHTVKPGINNQVPVTDAPFISAGELGHTGRETSPCASAYISTNFVELLRYHLVEGRVSMLALNLPEVEGIQNHLVWVAGSEGRHFLNQLYWYRLFSLLPAFFGVTNQFFPPEQLLMPWGWHTSDVCASYATIPMVNTDNTMMSLTMGLQDNVTEKHVVAEEKSDLESANLVMESYDNGNDSVGDIYSDVDLKNNSSIQPEKSKSLFSGGIVGDLVHAILTNTSHWYHDQSYLCFPDLHEDGNEHYRTSRTTEYSCCSILDPTESCTKKAPAPPVVLVLKMLLYPLWFLVLFPLLLVLPCHQAYYNANNRGLHDPRGEYYRIVDTSAMPWVLAWRSLLVRWISFILLLLLFAYLLLKDYSMWGPYWDLLPPIIYVGFAFSIISFVIFVIFFRRSLEPGHITDTLMGMADLPPSLQLSRKSSPLSDGMRMPIFSRMGLLVSHTYWKFCMCKLPKILLPGRLRITHIVLTMPFSILAIINTLPVGYIVVITVGALRRAYKRIPLCCILMVGPVLVIMVFLAAFISFQILYHSLAIILLDPKMIPVILIYLILIHHVSGQLSSLGTQYTQLITVIIAQHQKLVPNSPQREPSAKVSNSESSSVVGRNNKMPGHNSSDDTLIKDQENVNSRGRAQSSDGRSMTNYDTSPAPDTPSPPKSEDSFCTVPNSLNNSCRESVNQGSKEKVSHDKNLKSVSNQPSNRSRNRLSSTSADNSTGSCDTTSGINKTNSTDENEGDNFETDTERLLCDSTPVNGNTSRKSNGECSRDNSKSKSNRDNGVEGIGDMSSNIETAKPLQNSESFRNNSTVKNGGGGQRNMSHEDDNGVEGIRDTSPHLETTKLLDNSLSLRNNSTMKNSGGCQRNKSHKEDNGVEEIGEATSNLETSKLSHNSPSRRNNSTMKNIGGCQRNESQEEGNGVEEIGEATPNLETSKLLHNSPSLHNNSTMKNGGGCQRNKIPKGDNNTIANKDMEGVDYRSSENSAIGPNYGESTINKTDKNDILDNNPQLTREVVTKRINGKTLSSQTYNTNHHSVEDHQKHNTNRNTNDYSNNGSGGLRHRNGGRGQSKCESVSLNMDNFNQNTNGPKTNDNSAEIRGEDNVVNYDGKTLCIKAQFHDDILESTLSSGVCARQVIASQMILGAGMAALNAFFMYWVPYLSCCLLIIILLCMAVIKLLISLRQTFANQLGQWEVLVTAILQQHYVDMGFTTRNLEMETPFVHVKGNVYSNTYPCETLKTDHAGLFQKDTKQHPLDFTPDVPVSYTHPAENQTSLSNQLGMQMQLSSSIKENNKNKRSSLPAMTHRLSTRKSKKKYASDILTSDRHIETRDIVELNQTAQPLVPLRRPAPRATLESIHSQDIIPISRPIVPNKALFLPIRDADLTKRHSSPESPPLSSAFHKPEPRVVSKRLSLPEPMPRDIKLAIIPEKISQQNNATVAHAISTKTDANLSKLSIITTPITTKYTNSSESSAAFVKTVTNPSIISNEKHETSLMTERAPLSVSKSGIYSINTSTDRHGIDSTTIKPRSTTVTRTGFFSRNISGSRSQTTTLSTESAAMKNGIYSTKKETDGSLSTAALNSTTKVSPDKHVSETITPEINTSQLAHTSIKKDSIKTSSSDVGVSLSITTETETENKNGKVPEYDRPPDPKCRSYETINPEKDKSLVIFKKTPSDHDSPGCVSNPAGDICVVSHVTKTEEDINSAPSPTKLSLQLSQSSSNIISSSVNEGEKSKYDSSISIDKLHTPPKIPARTSIPTDNTESSVSPLKSKPKLSVSTSKNTKERDYNTDSKNISPQSIISDAETHPPSCKITRKHGPTANHSNRLVQQLNNSSSTATSVTINRTQNISSIRKLTSPPLIPPRNITATRSTKSTTRPLQTVGVHQSTDVSIDKSTKEPECPRPPDKTCSSPQSSVNEEIISILRKRAIDSISPEIVNISPKEVNVVSQSTNTKSNEHSHTKCAGLTESKQSLHTSDSTTSIDSASSSHTLVKTEHRRVVKRVMSPSSYQRKTFAERFMLPKTSEDEERDPYDVSVDYPVVTRYVRRAVTTRGKEASPVSTSRGNSPFSTAGRKQSGHVRSSPTSPRVSPKSIEF